MKKNLDLLMKIIIFIASGFSVFLNLTIAPVNKMILYFTVLSNILCFAYYFWYLLMISLNKLNKNDFYYIFKGMMTICLTLTMVVFNLYIKTNDLYSVHTLANLFAHIIVPFLTIFDYIIFGEKGHLKYKFTLWWGGCIALYTTLCWIYSMLGGTFIDGSKYPYDYMNIEVLGFGKVFTNCLLLFLGFMLYSLTICYLDKKSSQSKSIKLKR